MINYGRHSINRSDVKNVSKVLRSDFLTTGPLVEKFEEIISEFVNAPSIVVNSGTAALHAAYFAAEVTQGDEIVSPPITFAATQAMALHLGAKVIFADIDMQTGLIDFNDVKAKLSAKTKAVVVVDYAGQPCDIPKLRGILNNPNIVIIEDAAHSFGSTLNGRKVGSQADITTFSFFPTKNITTGEGGAVSTLNEKYLRRARLFSRQGVSRTKEDFTLDYQGPWHQEILEPGFNYRISDIHCALGISQMKRVDKFKKIRQRIVEYYTNNLKHVEAVEILKVNPSAQPFWHFFPILVPKEVRRVLVEYLWQNGVRVQVNYIPVYWNPSFRKNGYTVGLCPRSEEFYEREISLPVHAKLRKKDLDKIMFLISNFFSR